MKKWLAAALAVIAVAVGAIGAPAASAQPQQNGLVNLTVDNNTVQVPIGVAANVCDVNVAVLVNTFLDTAQPCTADAQPIAVTSAPPPGATPVQQDGLVNVDISGNTVQIPVAVALNVCDVNVALLTGVFLDQSAPCVTNANPRARQFGPGA
jgi:hypothetical protein